MPSLREAAIHNNKMRRRGRINQIPTASQLDLQTADWVVAAGASVTAAQLFSFTAAAGNLVAFAFTNANFSYRTGRMRWKGFVRLVSITTGVEPFGVQAFYADGGAGADASLDLSLTVAGNNVPFDLSFSIEDFLTGQAGIRTDDAAKAGNFEVTTLQLLAVNPRQGG